MYIHSIWTCLKGFATIPAGDVKNFIFRGCCHFIILMIIKCIGDNFVLSWLWDSLLSWRGMAVLLQGEPGLRSAAGEQGSPCPKGFTPCRGCKGFQAGLRQGLASGIPGAWWEVFPFSRLHLQGCTWRGWEAPVIWRSSVKEKYYFFLPTYRKTEKL